MRVVSQKLRDSARGQTCTLRLEGCGFDDGTVVLAHLPCGQKGIGIKGPDLVACLACHNCHSILDGRSHGMVTEGDMLRALAETQLFWIRNGLITIKGMKI